MTWGCASLTVSFGGLSLSLRPAKHTDDVFGGVCSEKPKASKPNKQGKPQFLGSPSLTQSNICHLHDFAAIKGRSVGLTEHCPPSYPKLFGLHTLHGSQWYMSGPSKMAQRFGSLGFPRKSPNEKGTTKKALRPEV